MCEKVCVTAEMKQGQSKCDRAIESENGKQRDTASKERQRRKSLTD